MGIQAQGCRQHRRLHWRRRCACTVAWTRTRHLNAFASSFDRWLGCRALLSSTVQYPRIWYASRGFKKNAKREIEPHLVEAIFLLRSSTCSVSNSFALTTTMADNVGGPDEAARLWRVNRTVHELVKDRVCSFCINIE